VLPARMRRLLPTTRYTTTDHGAASRSLTLAFSVSAFVCASLALFQHAVARSSPATAEIFTDVTSEAGITWRHFSGASEDRFLIETMGGGVAFLDFDGDGLQDIFFVNGGETPRGKSANLVRNALYRNLGDGKLQEVAEKAGVDKMGFYGMGAAAADYDNDGHTDWYVTGFPSSALFHNNGDGTFQDVTKQAGVNNAARWAASAAWFDYDRDGYLDLLVTNYVEFSFERPKKCEVNGLRSYCEQKAYTGMPLTLYHNNGNGTFSDVSERSGLAKLTGRALGVIALDVNDDGWPDLFVARDASPNLMLINGKDGTFREAGSEYEVAYDSNGHAKAGMGVDAGDVNGDGRPDFVVTNFHDEYTSLFMASRSALYEDKAVAWRLSGATKSYVSWGVHFLDYDNDGYLDLAMVNGHINQAIESTRKDVKFKEPPLLLHNDRQGAFQNVSDAAGRTFHTGYTARGLAVGDFNNDGATDLVFTRLDDTPVLLRNNAGQDNAWLGLELQGTKSNRDAIGAKITVTAGSRKLVRWITGGSSYLSSHDKRVIVGLGNQISSSSVKAEIVWPSGTVQQISDLNLNRYTRVVEVQESKQRASSQPD
jgi:enediyne biosynthesis protein E4